MPRNTTTIAANDPVWSFRWGQSEYAAVIRRISLDLSVTTAYGTDQATEYGLYFATSFTAVDTGGTARVIRGLLPRAHFATLYAKPAGRPFVDTFVREFAPDQWVYFPWDIEYRFATPIKDRAGAANGPRGDR